MERFLERHKGYYKDYYQKNIEKFRARNKARPSQKKIYHCIIINNVKYLFPSVKSMNIHKVNIDEIDLKTFEKIG